MIDYYDQLSPSQKKLFKEQEQWLKDTGADYNERIRTHIIHEIMERFPTEEIAKEIVNNGGYPAIIYLYSHGKVKKSHRKPNKLKSIKRCKCK